MTEPMTPEEINDCLAGVMERVNRQTESGWVSAEALRGVLPLLTELYRLQYALYEQGQCRYNADKAAAKGAKDKLIHQEEGLAPLDEEWGL